MLRPVWQGLGYDEKVGKNYRLRFMLEHAENMEVVGVAYDGKTAVALATTQKPHVILMDLKMPGMNGLQATRLIISNNPLVKIIIFSGSWG